MRRLRQLQMHESIAPVDPPLSIVQSNFNISVRVAESIDQNGEQIVPSNVSPELIQGKRGIGSVAAASESTSAQLRRRVAC